jgi:hypothetical protein
MPFSEPPPFAAWEHREARRGFEVVWFRPGVVEGHTDAVEEDAPFSVGYRIELDAGWVTRRALVTSPAGERRLEADGAGGWRIDGEPAPHLAGCLDADLESSSLTNAFPVHRMGLAVGRAAEAPAAYVRAFDLRVERLEQTYLRLEDDGDRQRYRYRSPAFDFECELIYDAAGLVLDYPGIAVRAA